MNNLSEYIMEGIIRPSMTLPQALTEIVTQSSIMSRNSGFNQVDTKRFIKILSDIGYCKEIVKYTGHSSLEDDDCVVKVWYTNNQIKVFAYIFGYEISLSQGHLRIEKDSSVKYRSFFKDDTNNSRSFLVDADEFMDLFSEMEVPVGKNVWDNSNAVQFVDDVKKFLNIKLKTVEL